METTQHQRSLPYRGEDIAQHLGGYLRARVSGSTRGVHPLVLDLLDHEGPPLLKKNRGTCFHKRL